MIFQIIVVIALTQIQPQRLTLSQAFYTVSNKK